MDQKGYTLNVAFKKFLTLLKNHQIGHKVKSTNY